MSDILVSLGHERISLAHRVKSSVKLAVKYMSDFERAAAETAVGLAGVRLTVGAIAAEIG